MLYLKIKLGSLRRRDDNSLHLFRYAYFRYSSRCIREPVMPIGVSVGSKPFSPNDHDDHLARPLVSTFVGNVTLGSDNGICHGRNEEAMKHVVHHDAHYRGPTVLAGWTGQSEGGRFLEPPVFLLRCIVGPSPRPARLDVCASKYRHPKTSGARDV